MPILYPDDYKQEPRIRPVKLSPDQEGVLSRIGKDIEKELEALKSEQLPVATDIPSPESDPSRELQERVEAWTSSSNTYITDYLPREVRNGNLSLNASEKIFWKYAWEVGKIGGKALCSEYSRRFAHLHAPCKELLQPHIDKVEAYARAKAKARGEDVELREINNG